MKLLITSLTIFALFICSCAGITGSSNSKKYARAIKKEGDVYLSQGNYTASLAKLLEAEKISPNDAQILNSLGLAYLGKKRYKLAEASFKKALGLTPDFTEAENNLGAVYLRQKRWDTAIAQFEKALEDLIYPTPQFPLVNIGWAYLGKQEVARAQEYFRKALEESPDFIMALHGLAQSYLHTGQTARAMSFLHQKLHKIPDAAILHADLAEGYEKQGNIRQAIKSWQLVLKLTSENSALSHNARKKIDQFLY